MDELIAKIAKRLETPLPGWDAHRKMINYPRPKTDNINEIDPGARESAVLALLYPKEGETHIILILRNSYDGTHSGQISFPGGKREPMDKHLHATALREAKEEVNIDPKTVNILGELSQVYIPPSRFIVTPFLGYSLERPNFVPDKHEVAKIIEAPLSLFEGDTHLKQKPMYLNIAKKNIDVKFFDVFGHTVWGATAMMLKEISEILTNDSID